MENQSAQPTSSVSGKTNAFGLDIAIPLSSSMSSFVIGKYEINDRPAVSIDNFLGDSLLRDRSEINPNFIAINKNWKTGVIERLIGNRPKELPHVLGSGGDLGWSEVFKFFEWKHMYKWGQMHENAFDPVNNVVMEILVRYINDKTWNRKPITVLTKVETPSGATEAQLCLSSNGEITMYLVNSNMTVPLFYWI
ncbi:hypothetical protein BMW23_0715 [Bodo saltans virus]|uniref:Uncharacterized protein n=1 Tax=Bodo saltans virus TaxID=2024608 RepID=A0A2H4UV15_9VIRU|nr:hypothetical protein QJ851_gp0698 [Bodo saltans virus]ATZ80761.1 hypothetical protein BMW23_0715 [Bodo saltans virus]